MAETSSEASVEIARPLQVVDAALFGPQARGEPEDVAGLEEITREGPGELRFEGSGGRAFALEHDPRQGYDRLDTGEARYTFRLIPLSASRTRVDLRVEHEAGLLERAQDALGALRRQVADDLGHFKDYVESTTDPPA